jgi:hypothetical protein
MSIIKIFGIYVCLTKANIKGQTHYLYKSGKDRNTAMNNMFSLISSIK